MHVKLNVSVSLKKEDKKDWQEQSDIAHTQRTIHKLYTVGYRKSNTWF